ncbi:hypothetical protein LINPERPRIM_LOCUS15524 [Linum perenne]
MAALNVSSPPSILDAMDTLWFHHTVLSFSSPPSTLPQSDELPNQEEKEEEAVIRPTRVSNIVTPVNVTGRCRSHSSSPLTKKRRRRRLGNRTRKQPTQPVSMFERTSSCRSLIRDLEMEEVKGFMDLGFRFKSDNLSPRMMTVVPGLQRLGSVVNDDETATNDDEEVVIRPYLSEAWLIRRPDSPLLNVRIPFPGDVTSDVRRSIKFWARNVATVIQQESY